METFPLNNLAGKFKVDRSTMVRAMRGVSPDEVARGKSRSLPWKAAPSAARPGAGWINPLARGRQGLGCEPDDVAGAAALGRCAQANFMHLEISGTKPFRKRGIWPG